MKASSKAKRAGLWTATSSSPGCLGYSVAELRGVEIASLIAPEDRDRVMANIRQGRESVIEHAMLRKDGTRIVVEAHGRPVSPGSTKRLTAIRDVTERKQAESELQNTLQRFYSVLSSMYSGLLLMTEEGRVEFVNQAFCDAYGLKEAPADLVGLASRDLLQKILPAFLHPVEAAARIQEVLQRGEPVRVEEFGMKGGRTALRSYIPLSLHGRSFGRLWIHTDITERRRAEEALRESERFIKSVAEASPHWFYVFDFDSRGLSYANRPLLRDLGYPPDVHTAVTGLDAFRGFMPPEEIPHLVRLIEEWQRLPDGLVRDDEYRLRHADGTLRYFAGREVVFARRSDGTVQRILGLLLDITERKQAEAEIGRRVEELRAANEELTRFNRVTVGRELRIIEMKKQVNELCARLGQPPRYAAELDEEAPPAKS